MQIYNLLKVSTQRLNTGLGNLLRLLCLIDNDLKITSIDQLRSNSSADNSKASWRIGHPEFKLNYASGPKFWDLHFKSTIISNTDSV